MSFFAIERDVSIGSEQRMTAPSKQGQNCVDDDTSTAAPSPRLDDLDSPISPYVKARKTIDSRKTLALVCNSRSGQTIKLNLPGTYRQAFKTISGLSCEGTSCHDRVPEREDFKCEIESDILISQDSATTHTVAPGTPRHNDVPFCTPPPAPKAEPMPPLMRALWKNSATLVEEAIQAEPDVARFPFWDHEVEPPLCFAMRHKCKADIIELLLQHGADFYAKDVRGKSPADILRSMHIGVTEMTSFEDLAKIENLLHVSPGEIRAFDTAPSEDFWECSFGETDLRVFDMWASKLPAFTSSQDQSFPLFEFLENSIEFANL